VLTSGRGQNLNTRAALLEVVNDALGSVAVLVAATVIAATGWLRADPLASLLIGVLIVPRTVGLLKETVDLNYQLYVRPFFWIPENTLRQHEKEDGVPYSLWVEQGLVTATEGDIIDST